MVDLTSLTTDEAQTVLLLGSTLDAHTTEAHQDLLTRTGDEKIGVLSVTYRESPRQILQAWEEHADGLPTRLGIIVMGGQIRGAQKRMALSKTAGFGPHVEAVNNPGDLTALSIKLNRYLDRVIDDELSLALCVDSLTAMLQHNDEETVFRFVQLISNRFKDSGTVMHYHLDPEAHADQTIATFRTLANVVVEVEDEEIRVKGTDTI